MRIKEIKFMFEDGSSLSVNGKHVECISINDIIEHINGEPVCRRERQTQWFNIIVNKKANDKGEFDRVLEKKDIVSFYITFKDKLRNIKEQYYVNRKLDEDDYNSL